MANSKYEYVKQFEQPLILLPNTYIVVRIDGKGFHKFTDHYKFEKPNDNNALQLMNKCAYMVMETFPDIFIAYGQSDEYSFVLSKYTVLFKRRSDKIASTICSTFTTYYTYFFKQFMNLELEPPFLPTFDSRCVCYPTWQNLRDYLSWRQADCHINNLYNTCFWALVKSGVNRQETEQLLSKTNAGGKNELLFSKFAVNYNNIDEMYKKGTLFVWETMKEQANENKNQFVQIVQKDQEQKLSRKQRNKLKHETKPEKMVQEEINESKQIKKLHLDIITNEQFWQGLEKYK